MVEKIEFTSQECEDYVWFAKQCLHYARMTKKSSVSAISNGDVVVICKYTPVKAILIVDSVNFYCHPKSADNLTSVKYYDTDFNEYSLITIDQGGWLKQTDGTWYPIDARLAYSLVDEDAGTFGLRSNETEPSAKYSGTKTQNYGNLYWYNSELNFGVLSWKGPPSIQFPLDPTYSIPGLTQNDGNSNTVYGANIYKSGSVLCQSPAGIDSTANLIVGACYVAGKLVAIIHARLASGYQLQVHTSADSGKSWAQIFAKSITGAATTPAFIAPGGKAFVYRNTQYLISDAVDGVGETGSISDAATGTRTISGGQGGYNSNYQYSGTRPCFVSMDSAGNMVQSAITVDAKFEESGDSSNPSKMVNVPLYTGHPATEVTIVFDRDVVQATCEPNAGYNAGFLASVNGAYCSATWSGVTCFKGLQAVKKLDTCNQGGYTVTCTVQPQGVSGSLTMPTINPSTLYIAGPIDAGVGAHYSVVGTMRGSVTWSISAGSINQAGNIESVDCGSATVTATDQCGNSASKSVRFPTGKWVTTLKRVSLNYSGMETRDWNCNDETGAPYLETRQGSYDYDCSGNCCGFVSKCGANPELGRAIVQMFSSWVCSDAILINMSRVDYPECGTNMAFDITYTYARP